MKNLRFSSPRVNTRQGSPHASCLYLTCGTPCVMQTLCGWFWGCEGNVCCPVQEIGINHLHIPTVDYLYAPPVEDLHRGVAFIAGGCWSKANIGRKRIGIEE